MANERYTKIIAVLGGVSILGLIALWCLLILQRTGVPHA